MRCRDYVALDLETTGLEPKNDKIIEIGAVRVRGGKIEKEYRTFVNPGRKIEERITLITGITDKDVEGAPYIEDVLEEVLDFIGDDILVGHSILFDYSFLKRAVVNAGTLPGKQDWEKDAVDTLWIARKYLPALPSRGLKALCEHYKIEHLAHRALGDAFATHYLLEKLAEEFYSEETKKDFAPVPLIYKVKREGPATPAQKKRLYAMHQMHKIEADYDVERLTKNEASRCIDKIILHFGKEGCP